MKKPLVILTGPTAVGKTDLSIELAKNIGGEIISADSMQIYKYMDIGTAKITPDEMQGIKHYLVDELEPSDDFNVFRFKCMAEEAINNIYSNKHIPIIVGGTGFYIQALLYDVNFVENENENTEYREMLYNIANNEGTDKLHDMLMEVDPESANQIHANNVKRTARALEYYHLTGKKISQHNKKEQTKESPYNFAYYVLNNDRKILYDRINKRVDLMMSQGLESEVEKLLQMGLKEDDISMHGIGYREFFKYFEGEISLDETIDEIKKDTRHFAKRQITWFKRERDVDWFDINAYDNSKTNILNAMLKDLKNKKII